MDNVLRFLEKHENKDGDVGRFIRSCIVVAEIAGDLTREELKNSAQLGYLLDCFATKDAEQDESGEAE